MAIVGYTGSGKSTLAQLMPRLMDPSAGDACGWMGSTCANSRRRMSGAPSAMFRRRLFCSARRSAKISRSA